MKLGKLFTGLLVFMFMLVPLVSALDVAPVISLNSDVDRTTTTITITATAVDILDNAGVAWIKLYEDGNEIASKECGLSTSCVLVKAIVKTAPAGTFTYRADAFDKGGHEVSSEDLVVRFAGVDLESPEYLNIQATPASPAPYGMHQFDVDWIDNGRIGRVYIEHNFFGVDFQTDVTQVAGDTYSYVLDDINSMVNLGTYRWRMTAEDVAEQGANTNTTPWQTYVIERASPTLVWSAVPDTTVVYGTQTSVECTLGEIENTETSLTFQRDGSDVLNPDVQTLSPGTYEYNCAGAQTPHYNAVSENLTITVDKMASQVDLLLNTFNTNVTVERLTGNVDMDGSIVTGDGSLELYVDGQMVANGSAPLSDSTNFNTTGTYNVTLVMPSTGNYSSAEDTHFVIVQDTVAPDNVLDFIIIYPAPPFMGNVQFAWENPANDDLAGVLIEMNGTPFINTTDIAPQANGTWSVYNATGLNHSTSYNFTIFTYDNDGNINTTGYQIVTGTPADSVAPVLSNAQGPSNGTLDLNATYTFSVDVADNFNEVDTVELIVDAGTPVTATGVNGTYTVNLTGLTGGLHTWQFTANDTSSNSNSTPVYNFTLDKLASDVNLTLNGAHQNITVFVNEQFSLNGTLVAGEGNISYYVDSVLDPTSPEPSPITRNVAVASARVVNFTIVYDETANYSASSDTLFVTVIPIIRNVSLSSSPAVGYTAYDVNATYTITITNTGNIVDNYTLSLTNTDSADFASLSNLTAVNVSPNSTAEVTLTVGDNDTGVYNVTVDIVSDNDGAVTDSLVVTTNVVDYSTVVNSYVDGTYYASGNYTAVQIPELVASNLVDSNVSDNLSSIQVSDVQRSTVTNSTVINSNINDSTIVNSALTNCTVLNSTVLDTTSSNCHIEDSYVDPSDTTGSTITGGSSIVDSNVTYSTVDNSDITNSHVDVSTVTDSTIDNSAVDNSTVDNSVVEDNSDVDNSNVTDSTVRNSDVDDSTIDQGSVFEDSTASNAVISNSNVDEQSTVTDSTVVGSTLFNATVNQNSVITDSTITSSTITNSTVTNSTIPAGTTVLDAVILNGVIMNGTVDGTTYTNSTNLTDVVNYAPVAGISASSTSIKEGESITFTSTSTDANIGGALNDSLAYAWTVDGSPAGNSSTLVRSFSSEATYVVGLTVTDLASASDATTVSVSVTRKSSGRGSSSRNRASSGPRTITLNITRGSFVTLDLNQGDRVEFMFEGENHRITVVDMTTQNATLRVEPGPIQIVVDEYETDNVNLDDDQFNDLSLKFEQAITSNTGKFTIGLREIPSYNPIVIPDVQPQVNDTVEPEVNDTVEDNETAEPEEEELGLWARFVGWLKAVFGISDEEVSAEGTVALEGEDAEEPEVGSEVTGAVTADADEEDSPRAFLGIALAFLVIALGIAVYFVARKKVLEKRIEKYLM